MTREQWSLLADEEKRIKVAKLCGWKSTYIGTPGTTPCSLDFTKMPDYLNDLNAMHKAEKLLEEEPREQYIDWLDQKYLYPAFTTAAQRAEAFVITMEPNMLKAIANTLGTTI